MQKFGGMTEWLQSKWSERFDSIMKEPQLRLAATTLGWVKMNKAL